MKILLIPVLSTYGQEDSIYNKVKYAWPYLDECPRYIAVYGGFSAGYFIKVGFSREIKHNG